MDQINLSNILGSSAYFTINKFLAKEIGLYATIVLSDLISKEKYFVDNNKIDNEGYFFNTHDNIEKDTTLSKHKQIKALKILKEKGFIDIKIKGIPAKNHFKINSHNIILFFNISNKPLKNLTTVNKEIKQPVEKKLNGNDNNNELKLINIYKEIFNHWNSKNITVHRKLNNDMKDKIKEALKKYDKTDIIIKGIDNYNIILKGNDYFWTHPWTLKDFIVRGLYRFIDESNPFIAFKNKGGMNEKNGRSTGGGFGKTGNQVYQGKEKSQEEPLSTTCTEIEIK